MQELAATIDHTRLAAESTREEIVRLCREAVDYGFAAVCVPPVWVKDAVDAVSGSPVAVATVVGFPLGYTSTAAKVTETREALTQGASEIDMVVQIGAVQQGDWALVEADVAAVLAEVRRHPDALLKVIVESCYLDDDQLERMCALLARLKVDFVKTSTGFGKAGATVETVARMRALLPADIRIKASGGIRTREFALLLLQAGADRIGTSSGILICQP